MINFRSSQCLTVCSLVAILHQNCAFQRSKNAALVVNSLIQLHVIETFSDNSSDMCHRECKHWRNEYSESANDEDDEKKERDFE